MADFLLEVVEGPNAGSQLALDRPVEIGRDPGAAIVLHDDLVSRRHARITPTRGGATLEDLGSTNGTFINGNEVHAPTFASAGDQILMGVSVVQLRSAQQVADRPSAVRQVPDALRIPEQRPDYLPPDLQRASAVRAPAPAGGPPQQGPTGPVQPVGRPPETPVPELDPLLDVHTKRLAFVAPIGIIVVVALAVILFLVLR